MTMELAGQMFDLENLTRNMVVFMYCGASDWYEWAMYRDRKELARWKWIIWDLEGCFSDQWKTSAGPLSEQHWLQVAVSKSPKTGQWRNTHRDIRTLLFTSLMNNDPKYREYFLKTLDKVLNHDINYEYLAERIRLHRALSSGSPETKTFENSVSLSEIENFLSSRAKFIQDDIKHHWY